VSPADKQARLDGATQVRLYWGPTRGYNTTYGRMRTRIEKWFDQHKAELGVNYQALRDLVVFVENPGLATRGWCARESPSR
jgi:hypothetical protein